MNLAHCRSIFHRRRSFLHITHRVRYGRHPIIPVSSELSSVHHTLCRRDGDATHTSGRQALSRAALVVAPDNSSFAPRIPMHARQCNGVWNYQLC